MVIPIIRDPRDKFLDQEREHAKSQLVERARSLELQIARLEASVSALELALERDHRKATLDLPNPLTHVN